MTPWTRNMTQTATYWAPTGSYDEYGRVAFSAPVTIACRWEDRAELVRTAEGDEFTSSSVVYPEKELARQGYLFLGTSVATDPRTVSGAHEIRQKGRSPSLAGLQVLNKVWL